jgi:hypothetical protein
MQKITVSKVEIRHQYVDELMLFCSKSEPLDRRCKHFGKMKVYGELLNRVPYRDIKRMCKVCGVPQTDVDDILKLFKSLGC